MKRFLMAAAFVVAGLLTFSCDTLDDVEADTTLYCIFADGDGVVLGPYTYGPYYSYPLSKDSIFDIFYDMTKNIRVENVATAHMHVNYIDRISRDFIGEEAYQFTNDVDGFIVEPAPLQISY